MIRWDDMPEYNSLASKVSQLEFKRISDYTHSMYGDSGAHPNDVMQGSIGNCWVMASMSAIAEVETRVHNMMFTDSYNDEGIYALKFWALGSPVEISVDDKIPVWKGTNSGIFAKLPDNSFWSVITEKAMAKYHGNYESLVSGDPRHSALIMTGSPAFWHTPSDYSEADLWAMIMEHNDANEIMMASTPGDGNDQDQDALGIAKSHAYACLGGVTVNNGSDVNLVKIRNPWGQGENYKGPWCDSCSEWTPELRAAAGSVVGDDGVWFIPLNLFRSNFDGYFVAYDSAQMEQSYWMRLGDTYNNPGSLPWCSGCTRHEFSLTSPVAQTVYIAANTWMRRTYPTVDCQHAYYGSQSHSLIHSGMGNTWQSFWGGNKQLDPYEMTAGQTITVKLELDWTRTD